MDTRTATDKYRLMHWAKIIQDRENSGMTVKAYCESVGIREHVYYHRLKKLRESACNELMRMQERTTDVVPLGFTEVKMQTNSAVSLSTASVLNHVCIETGGMRISASCEYPVEKLTEILRTAVHLC